MAVTWYAFVVKKSSPFEPIGQYIGFVSLFTLPLPLRASITTDIEGGVSIFLPTIIGYLPGAVLLTAMPLFAVSRSTPRPQACIWRSRRSAFGPATRC